MKFGSAKEVIDGRVAFQSDTEDQFTAAIERLTRREVVAFLSANQTLPGARVSCSSSTAIRSSSFRTAHEFWVRLAAAAGAQR